MQLRMISSSPTTRRPAIILRGAVFVISNISYLCNMEDLVLFDIPKLVKASARRRTRSAARVVDGDISSRADRIAKRNRILTARYYYWTELERRRFDDTLRILSDSEFFLEERTISNALMEQDEFFNSLLKSRTTKRQLRRMFPGFDWG